MAVDGDRKITEGHAAAVVGDADPPPAAAVGENVDAAGAGVDGVFDQFLDHARGTFDHLAGGDAVDDLFGKLADGHGKADASIRGWAAIVGPRDGKCMGRSRSDIRLGMRVDYRLEDAQLRSQRPGTAPGIVRSRGQVYRLEKL